MKWTRPFDRNDQRALSFGQPERPPYRLRLRRVQTHATTPQPLKQCYLFFFAFFFVFAFFFAAIGTSFQDYLKRVSTKERGKVKCSGEANLTSMTLPHFVDKIIIGTLLIVCQEKNDILQNIFIENFYQDKIFLKLIHLSDSVVGTSLK